MNLQYSLITINHNRTEHLNNLLQGLDQGSELPDEVIVVNIGKNTPKTREAHKFPVKNCTLTFDLKDGLPVGKARNLGAEKASHKNLIFLDVDCIPSKSFIEIIKKQSSYQDGIIMGTPKYLKQSIRPGFKEYDLAEQSIFHPRRPRIDCLTLESSYELFWSLCFYISKLQFDILGGFDENYTGYGGEDTDLAFKAREQYCPFYLSEAIVYHQPHTFYSPPLNQFEHIINNCEYFHSKWGIWPMDKHLRKFAEMKLIDWKPNYSESIRIRSKPSEKAIKKAEVKDKPFA